MATIRKVTCPVCEASFELGYTFNVDDTIRCPFCTIDLKVIALKSCRVEAEDVLEKQGSNFTIEGISERRGALRKEGLW